MSLLPETNDTIVAQATPQGAGALAVLRLSGPEAFKVAAAFFFPAPVNPTHGQARLLSVKEGATLVDRTVVVFFKGPASYTGQDTVEITCHGSPYIIRTILRMAVNGGARPAQPGEFTLRAFLNGKLDLAQAEAVGSLIEAGSAGAHRAAITQAEGLLSAEVRAIKTSLVDLLAEIEARLDDSHEEIPELEAGPVCRRIDAARADTLRLAGAYGAGRGIRDGIKVVITGAPNAGKSSLLNALLGYERAMVSKTSGTTRDTLEARLEVDGFSVLFTDTAGISQQAVSPLEREGIRRAGAAISSADAVVLVKDSSTKETRSDRLAESETGRLAMKGTRLIRVLSKADLPQKRKSGPGMLRVSAVTGLGIPRLKAALVSEQKKIFRDGSQALVTSARHFAALSAAAVELRGAARMMKGSKPRTELAAEHLRAALEALASILGETAPEEILAEIFRGFCVGK